MANRAAYGTPLGKRVKTGNTPMEVAVAAISDVLTVQADETKSLDRERQQTGAETR